MEITEIDSKISNKIASFEDNGLIDLVQGGTTSTEDGVTTRWIKCRFKESGVTYCFTPELYVDGIKANDMKFTELLSETPKMISDAIIESLETSKKSETINESELTEAEATEKAATTFPIPKTITVKLSDNDDLDWLPNVFNDAYGILEVVDGAAVPAPVEIDFMAKFLEGYDYEGNSLKQNRRTTTTAYVDGIGVVVYTDHLHIPTTGAEIWHKGIEPLCYFGKKCVKTPTTTADLDEMEFALTNFDDIVAVNDPEDDLPDDEDDAEEISSAVEKPAETPTED